MRVEGLGFKVWRAGSGVEGSGSRVWGLGLRFYGILQSWSSVSSSGSGTACRLGCGVLSWEFEVGDWGFWEREFGVGMWGVGCRVWGVRYGLEFRVLGMGCGRGVWSVK